ncbi:MAG: PAS domain S-box protein [Gammaproteobacteria bacterium]|nr:PAS domain S-box protein [Gammaproteobacteria bacterium]
MLVNQRLGFSVIIATIVVMLATVYLFFDYQRDSRETMAKAQGLELARLLGGMSWEELIPDNGRQGLLEALNRGQSNPDFAYAAVIGLDAELAFEVTRRGVIVPADKVASEPSAWLGQRILTSRDNNTIFIDSHAPVFSNGVHKGFVRLGHFQPKLVFGYSQLPFLATLTLPIFLLSPLFYFMLRQQMKPLGKISENIEKLAGQGGLFQFELQPDAMMGDFMTRFGQFIEATQERIKTLDEQQNSLQMSSKLLTYKNHRIDTILQNFPDAIMVIDEAGEVSYVNSKIQRLLCIDGDNVMGKKTREWCEDPQILPLLTFSDTKSSLQANQNTIRISAEDGQDKSLQFNVYPLFVPNDDSRILGRLVVVRDVSESQAMRHRQNEFVSHIAHELKTPLNVLAMYSESLLTEGAENEAYRVEAVNVIHDEVERLSTLINNLLSLNQYELGGLVAQRQHVRIHELLDDAMQNVSQARGDKDLEFDQNIPREMSSVFIDKDMFRIAINNLLTNAIKYNKPGGKVSLVATEDEDSIEIRISDEGYGISPEDQKHIFDKFYRSDAEHIRKQVGHGLGLSLARQIIRMHHGELNVNSELGKGSEFVIKLEKISSQILDTAS